MTVYDKLFVIDTVFSIKSQHRMQRFKIKVSVGVNSFLYAESPILVQY